MARPFTIVFIFTLSLMAKKQLGKSLGRTSQPSGAAVMRKNNGNNIWSVISFVIITLFPLLLFSSSGCMLDSRALGVGCEDTFVGGCFEHVDGRENGIFTINNLDPSCEFSGVAENLSELGAHPDDIWVFFGEALEHEEESEQRAVIQATWENVDGTEESTTFDAFYNEDTAILTLRLQESLVSVNLHKVPCIPE